MSTCLCCVSSLPWLTAVLFLLEHFVAFFSRPSSGDFIVGMEIDLDVVNKCSQIIYFFPVALLSDELGHCWLLECEMVQLCVELLASNAGLKGRGENPLLIHNMICYVCV